MLPALFYKATTKAAIGLLQALNYTTINIILSTFMMCKLQTHIFYIINIMEKRRTVAQANGHSFNNMH